MNTSQRYSTLSLQDKIILLGFFALTTVGVIQGRAAKIPASTRYFSPHELPNGDVKGQKKLHQYRHQRWGGGGDAASHSSKRKDSTSVSLNIDNALQGQLLIMLHQQVRGGAAEGLDDSSIDSLDWNRKLDCSDNPDQVRVLRHHYLNEFGHHISLSQVLKDYSETCTIHHVVDNQPQTFHGQDGARQAFLQVFNMVPHDLSHQIEFEHIAIDHNHAQVVWKAEIPSENKMIRGMDSFAFDKNNRIVHQSVMALSVPMNKDARGDVEDSGVCVDKF
ncbi:hypothetical protein IV203_027931 [Nitzschia inconspicua]|uniref:SnoaL-like domain-containing protein n=1 Tax=Nitzschia inconspicua TaxID=303405 RepID=A0A9K3LYM7_9STRA|nr:hypothetical protein IV203_027931 [Nitzschia inconspicua]